MITFGHGFCVIHGHGRVVDCVDDDGQCAGIGPAIAVRDGVGDGVCAVEVGGWCVVDSGVIRVDGSGSGP